jgi:hypothetical protein
MDILYDTLMSLASAHDGEMREGYERYESLLAGVLTAEQMAAYADYIRQQGEIRIFEEMTPDELAALPAQIAVIAATVLGDINLSMENRRVVALLNQRGEHEVAPDLGDTSESTLSG